MWKWLGFIFGLANLGLFAAALFFPDTLFKVPAVSFTGPIFLAVVIMSSITFVGIMGASDDRYTRGFGWISGISIFFSVLVYFLTKLFEPSSTFGWELIPESLIVGSVIFGVPISVTILLILNMFRKYKA